MTFYDELRDPRSEEEFWAIIDETFIQVEGVFTGYPVETREDALSGTFRIHHNGDTFRSSPGDMIRYRGVDADYDSRDYFLEAAWR